MTIKIVIVEDEPPIARLLARCIEQTGLGFFRVIGMAINGRDALDILSKEKADVVFTDIRMPVMDGLDLLEEIHDRYPDIISVILSGYQNFDYAQIALRRGAFDYLLKPISIEAVSTLLTKIQSVYSERKAQQKQNQLLGIIHGETPEEASISQCIAILICAGPFPLVADDILLPGKVFWQKHNLKKLLNKLGARDDEYFVFNGATLAEKYIVIEKYPPDSFHDLTQTLYDELTSKDSISITMVSHHQAVPFTMVGNTVKSLRSCLSQEMALCSSKFIWDDHKLHRHEKKGTLDTDLLNNIIEYIYAQEEGKLRNAIERLAGNAPGVITQYLLSQMLDLIIADSRLEFIDDSSGLSDVKAGLNEAISYSKTIGELCSGIASVLLPLNRGQKGKREMREVVEQVEQYLVSNYTKSISSEMLSKKFGFVPSYLSKVFRSEKGMSPSEYLTNYRIEKAKSIFEAQPRILIRDVAKATGYDDPYYFSKMFKKQTGKWPKEFQESCRITY